MNEWVAAGAPPCACVSVCCAAGNANPRDKGALVVATSSLRSGARLAENAAAIAECRQFIDQSTA
eukprot:352249-Chlamydomonas_euryale.AAC.23